MATTGVWRLRTCGSSRPAFLQVLGGRSPATTRKLYQGWSPRAFPDRTRNALASLGSVRLCSGESESTTLVCSRAHLRAVSHDDIAL